MPGLVPSILLLAAIALAIWAGQRR